MEPTNNQEQSEVKNKSKLPKKKLGIVLGLVMAVALAVFVIFKLTADDSGQNSGGSGAGRTHQNSFAQDYLRNCPDREVSFSHSPIATDEIKVFEPLGKVNDGHVTPTDHVYITPTKQASQDNTTAVVMPADGTVSVVSAMPAEYVGDRNQQTAKEDHRIAVVHNCQYVSIFIHIHKLSDKLRAEVGSLEPNENKQTSVELKAGETIGYIGASPVDWTLADASKTLSGFISPELYQNESWKIHTIDPISVYSGELKSRLEELSPRTVEPFGGRIDYDIKDTLQGNWFKEGTNGYSGASRERYWDGHLAINPDYIDPSATSFSIGNWNGKAAQFTVAQSGVKPDAVTASSGAVKYELVKLSYNTASGQPFNGQASKGMRSIQDGPLEGTVLLQVMAGEKLKIETFPGKKASQVAGFTSAAQVYVR